MDRAAIVHENLLRRVAAEDFPAGEAPQGPLGDAEAVSIFRSACLTRVLDQQSRAMQAAGQGSYTLGSSGHEGMAAVAAALRGAVRVEDAVGRFGGDEFLVICPDTGLDAAVACAERVRFAVESTPLKTAGVTLNMSVSIGVATRDTVMTDPDALIKRADQALYLAKNKGRNRIMTAQSLRPGPIVPPR